MTEFTLDLPVRYYETDQMGIVHHSNYIRYCETTRLGFLDSIGLNFAQFERSGFVSPVLGFALDFKRPALFGDTVRVKTWIKEFKGARIWFAYDITNQNGEQLSTGESSHTFCDKSLKPVNLKKTLPEIYDKLQAAARVD